MSEFGHGQNTTPLELNIDQVNRGRKNVQSKHCNEKKKIHQEKVQAKWLARKHKQGKAEPWRLAHYRCVCTLLKLIDISVLYVERNYREKNLDT